MPTVRLRHYSGIQAVSRLAYEQAGGYVEIEGWAYEDSVQDIIWRHFTNGLEWLHGAAYHLWHPGPDRQRNAEGHELYETLHTAEATHGCTPEIVRAYLARAGHLVPTRS
jgi:hypothetical protein